MNHVRILTIAASLALAAILGAGCGDDSSNREAPKKSSKPEKAPRVVEAPKPGEGGTIAGRILFDGEAPKPRAIAFGGERKCAELHGDQAPVMEDLVVGTDGGIRWVLVHVASPDLGSFDAPTAKAVIDQKGCLFHPHVAAVQVGQPVEFLNSDPVLHNVRAQPTLNEAVNIAQPEKGSSTTIEFAQPELGIGLKCDVHFWMAGWVHVFTHPYFAVTAEDGSFEIRGLKDGTYTIETWHEKLGTQKREVVVKDGQITQADVTYRAN